MHATGRTAMSGRPGRSGGRSGGRRSGRRCGRRPRRSARRPPGSRSAPCLALGLAVLAACATVPRESVALSEELGARIASARAAHLRLLATYLDERRDRVDEFMDRVWSPTFMERYVPDSGILDSLAAAPTAARKGELMRLFAEAGTREIARARAAKMRALDGVARRLERRIDAHYDEMRTLSQALTAHLRSAADVTEIREEMGRRLGLEARPILPLDEVNERLERLITLGGDVEAIVEQVEALERSIRELLEREGG